MWRLGMMALGNNDPNILGGASEDVQECHLRMTSLDSGSTIIDDRLSEQELSFIAGTYLIYNGEFDSLLGKWPGCLSPFRECFWNR